LDQRLQQGTYNDHTPAPTPTIKPTIKPTPTPTPTATARPVPATSNPTQTPSPSSKPSPSSSPTPTPLSITSVSLICSNLTEQSPCNDEDYAIEIKVTGTTMTANTAIYVIDSSTGAKINANSNDFNSDTTIIAKFFTQLRGSYEIHAAQGNLDVKYDQKFTIP
jgi:hypothetical protein